MVSTSEPYATTRKKKLNPLGHRHRLRNVPTLEYSNWPDTMGPPRPPYDLLGPAVPHS